MQSMPNFSEKSFKKALEELRDLEVLSQKAPTDHIPQIISLIPHKRRTLSYLDPYVFQPPERLLTGGLPRD